MNTPLMTRTKNAVSIHRLSFCSCLALGLLFAGCQPNPQAAISTSPDTIERFDGETIRVLVDDGVIDETLIRHAQNFERQTGANVEVTAIPYEELHDTALEDFANSPSQYDAIIFALPWIVDYAEAGYLADLSDLVVADKDLQWDDIAPFFRDFAATHRDRVYGIPLDGDYHMVYYRIDALENAGLTPPKTWDDYLAIAETLHGQDFTGDGKPDYGSCIPKKPGRASWFFSSIAVSYLQSHGTSQGAFFDPETMDPLVNNAAFARALDVFKQTSLFGPADEMTYDVDSHIKDMELLQHCAQTIFWGDIALLAVASDTQLKENIGTALLPGSTEVLDRNTGDLAACDKFQCPYAINGINHAPFAANIGFAGGINANTTPEAKAVSYGLMSYISQPAQSNVDVTKGISGFNPYRVSHFTNQRVWLKSGMTPEVANRYLGVIGASLNNDNMVLDLIIPQTHRYQQVLDSALVAFLRDEISREDVIAQIETGWNAITDEIGREQQLTAYRRSLGL